MDAARRELGHLLRRAGFGASPAELDAALQIGYDATLERLLAPESVDDAAAEARLAALDVDPRRLDSPRLVWLQRMLLTQRPLQEKMVLFWHGHLTSAAGKIGGRRAGALLEEQLALFREHALGDWRALLQ